MTISTEPTQELVNGSMLPSEVGSVNTTAPEVGSVNTTAPTYERAVTTAIVASAQAQAPAPSVAVTEDPVLAWLAGPEARQYENHWVALDPRTGRFLGMADALPSLRMWQARGALVVYVDPPPENWSDE